MISIVEKEERLRIENVDANCNNVCGDEDNCCEFGFDKMPIFNTVTLFDMLE